MPKGPPSWTWLPRAWPPISAAITIASIRKRLPNIANGNADAITVSRFQGLRKDTNARITAKYIAAGWYAALAPPRSGRDRPSNGPTELVGGRTAGEATAAVRRLYPRSTPQEVRRLRRGEAPAIAQRLGQVDRGAKACYK